MTLTILRIMYLRLRNNPLELLLVLVLPIVFFSIFAAIFSNGIATGTDKPVRVCLVTERESDTAGRQLQEQLLTALQANESLLVQVLSSPEDESALDHTDVSSTAVKAQETGDHDVVICLPSNTTSGNSGSDVPSVELLTDGQNPIAVGMVSAVVKAFFAQWQAQKMLQERLGQTIYGRERQRPVANSPAGSQSRPPDAAAEVTEAFRLPDAPIPGRDRFPAVTDPRTVFGNNDGDAWIDSASTTPPAPGGATETTGTMPYGQPDSFIPDARGAGIPARDPAVAYNVAAESTGSNPGASGALPGGMAGEVSSRVNGLPGAGISGAVPPRFVDRPVWAQNIGALSGSGIDLAGSDLIAEFDSNAEAVNVLVRNPQSAEYANPRIAMYAAGIAVLFLLFSATGNAAALLEEAESGTLDRILTSRAGLMPALAGKWIGIFLLGCLQITVMFLWAEMIYSIQLPKHLAGFIIMTISTSAATASFAMLLATLCRTRSQLNAASVVIILSMSAVGGSMIPRFAMSERMKEIGQWTFNAWALDGYQKVFWYQQPIDSLRDEVLALVGSAVILGLGAVICSSRWRRG